MAPKSNHAGEATGLPHDSQNVSWQEIIFLDEMIKEYLEAHLRNLIMEVS